MMSVCLKSHNGQNKMRLLQEEFHTSPCQSEGCAPDEQMLQLLLVTHINREQMATQVAGEREGGRGGRLAGGGGGSRKADLIEIDVFANRRMCSKTQRGGRRGRKEERPHHSGDLH